MPDNTYTCLGVWSSVQRRVYFAVPMETDAEETMSDSQMQALAQALADTSDGLTGTEIGQLLSFIGMADPSPDMTKWKRLYNAFVTRQNYSQNRRAIVEFVRRALRPERYAKEAHRFETMRANANRALAFCGLAVDATGKVLRADRAATLDEASQRADELRASLSVRGVHPDVLRFCRAELVKDNYFHAVLEAAKSIFDKLRAKTGFTEDGAPLVDRALAGDPPKLAINAFTAESQKSEQRGFANLLKGTYGMFRNTTAHEARIHWPMGKADAEDLLTLASMIHRRLDAAVIRP
jgi:uncharacterized protein (TIGR02391 family)